MKPKPILSLADLNEIFLEVYNNMPSFFSAKLFTKEMKLKGVPDTHFYHERRKEFLSIHCVMFKNNARMWKKKNVKIESQRYDSDLFDNLNKSEQVYAAYDKDAPMKPILMSLEKQKKMGLLISSWLSESYLQDKGLLNEMVLDACIEFLKENDYKIMKPSTQWEEI